MDYTTTGEEFAIVECKECRFKFTNPRPDQSSIHTYYQSEAYISHQDQQKSALAYVYKAVRKFALKNKLRLINSLQTPGTLLDIGCGTGAFLEVGTRGGWQAKGVEPDEKTRIKASTYSKSEIRSDLFDWGLEKFDVITMWHVLEHVHELEKSLEKISTLLEEKGHLIVAVPNCNSADAKEYGPYWAAYDLPRHLYHFTQKDMAAMLNKHGLTIKATKPMIFDAYYISLMSEKYKNGKPNYVNAFVKGYQSNRRAKKNGLDYSSLLYIIQK